MALDEKLFSAVHRRLQSWFGSSPSDGSEHRVDLEDVAASMRVLASVLTGRSIDVQPAEFDGGMRGPVLLLPRCMDFGASARIHRAAYAFRVAYDLQSRALGYAWDGGDDRTRALAALLAAPATLAALDRAWPGLATLREPLFEALLAHRPLLRAIPDQSASLECLHQALLGRARSELRHEVGADVVSWCERAIATHVPATDLQRTVTAVAADDPKPSRRRKPSRIDLPLFGRLASEVSVAKVAAPNGRESEFASSLQATTEREGQTRDAVQIVEVNQNEESMNPLVHVLEKLFTAEEYQGGQKSLDGSDELEEHGEALDELQLRHVVRTQEHTASLYRSDIQMDVQVSDLEAESIDPTEPTAIYPEWNEKKRAFRDNWCSVFARTADPLRDASRVHSFVGGVRQGYSAEIRQVRTMFDHIERQRALRNRQRDGSDIDLDAIVDLYAGLKAAEKNGLSICTDRLYLARRRHNPDFALLVLIDSSLSTDSWIEGRRVLDIVRESTLVLGEALSGRSAEVALCSFHSNTRRSCFFETLKGFDEPWRRSHARLAALKPRGYTRIGPAIRHATHLLSRVAAKKKVLLLLSDGKPTDYDRYEGAYGVADVRQALREAKQLRIRPFALTVEKAAKGYLPQMFGVNGYRILGHPRALPMSLAEVYRDLL